MPDPAKGTIIQWNATAIPHVLSFSGPGVTHEMVEVTDLNDAAVDRIASGVMDGGEVTVELDFDPDNAVHSALLADCISGASRVCAIVWLNGTSATSQYTFNSFCSSFSPGGAVKGALTASATITANGTINV